MTQQEGYKSDMESYREQLASYDIRLGAISEVDETFHRVTYSYKNGKGSLIMLKGDNVNVALLSSVQRQERIQERIAQAK